jgi:hypothetical protein
MRDRLRPHPRAGPTCRAHSVVRLLLLLLLLLLPCRLHSPCPCPSSPSRLLGRSSGPPTSGPPTTMTYAPDACPNQGLSAGAEVHTTRLTHAACTRRGGCGQAKRGRMDEPSALGLLQRPPVPYLPDWPPGARPPPFYPGGVHLGAWPSALAYDVAHACIDGVADRMAAARRVATARHAGHASICAHGHGTPTHTHTRRGVRKRPDGQGGGGRTAAAAGDVYAASAAAVVPLCTFAHTTCARRPKGLSDHESPVRPTQPGRPDNPPRPPYPYL